MADLTGEFLRAFAAGQVCLHPTDTLPGLTFDPESAEARHALTALKGRLPDKPCLALVSSLARAQEYFAPLPPGWERALGRLWPGPLSVVWCATALVPEALKAADGTVGLRVPELPADAAWFRRVLETAALPLPTTSVNRSGEAPAADFRMASRQLQGRSVFLPEWSAGQEAKEATPSTVIRLLADGSYTVLRMGAVSVEEIDAALRAGN